MGGNDASSVLRGHFSSGTVNLAIAVVTRFLRHELSAWGQKVLVAPPIPRHKDTRYIRGKRQTIDITQIFEDISVKIFNTAKDSDPSSTIFLDPNIFSEAQTAPGAYNDKGDHPGVHIKREEARTLAAEPLAAALQPLLQ